MGETVNLAARLQAVAAPDTVVISGDSERLVRGLFVLQDLGPQTLKGLPRPIPAYQVSGATGVRGRLDLLGADNLTPFIGRDSELRSLLEEWEQVAAGHGRVASISGEPGIGKSRLTRALREELTGASHTWLEAQCSPWSENTAFYPVIDLHRRLLGVRDQDPPEETLARLEAALEDAGLAVDEALPLFAALHGVPLPEDRQPPPMSREAQRRKTLETLCDWVLRLGHERPVVFLIEDVQWIDPSTAELVGLLIEQLAERPLLLLFTHRPDYTPPWAAQLTVRLERLVEDEARRIVEDVASGDGLLARAAAGDRRSGRRRAALPGGAHQSGAGVRVGSLHHPCDAARLAHVPPRPARSRQGARAARLRDRARVLVPADRRGVAGRRTRAARRARPTGRERARLSGRRAPGRQVPVQARADPRRGLSVALQVGSAAVPRADRSNARGAVSAGGGGPSRAGCAPLPRGGRQREGSAIPHHGRAACGDDLGERGSHPRRRSGSRRAERLARVGAAEPARDGPLHAPRRGADRDPRLCVG